jgi:hypothetical protein
VSDIERLEPAERAGGAQIEDFAIRAADRIGEGAEPGVHMEAVANGVEDEIQAHPEQLGSILEAATASLVELAGAAGVLLDKVGTLLETASEMARGGAEWIRDNPETFRAVCELVAFVAIAAARPDLIETLLERAPVERWVAALPSPDA